MRKISTIIDKSGNKIIIQNNGDIISLLLKLCSEKRERKIGDIDIANRVLTIKRSRFRHFHTKSGSYGFNHQILNEAKKFDSVLLIDEHGGYLIPRLFILENGKFLYFKQQGFEKQIFLAIDKIESFEVKSEETEAKF